jgi:hypothetical protein
MDEGKENGQPLVYRQTIGETGLFFFKGLFDFEKY